MAPKIKIGKKKTKKTDNTVLYIKVGVGAVVLIFMLLELASMRRGMVVEGIENKCDVCRGIAALSVNTMNSMFQDARKKDPDAKLNAEDVMAVMCTDEYYDKYMDNGWDGDTIDMGDRDTAQMACNYLMHEDTSERDSGRTFRQIIAGGLQGQYSHDKETNLARRQAKYACGRTGMCAQSELDKVKDAAEAKQRAAQAFQNFIGDAEKAYEERYGDKK